MLLTFLSKFYYVITRYLVTIDKKERKLSKEILLTLFASLYLGFAMFFVMLSFGLNL